MSVKIRLQRHGKKGKPFYWIVAADSRSKRDGKYLEKLGTYNPNTNPATIEIDIDSSVNTTFSNTDTNDNGIYIKGTLDHDGSVGIIGNGAGLVMSTLDVVAEHGGKAANFCDIGGGAKAETVTAALEVLESEEEVTSVLVNIFGGITRCDLVAEGIVAATKGKELKWPLIIRLDGTNSKEGLEI